MCVHPQQSDPVRRHRHRQRAREDTQVRLTPEIASRPGLVRPVAKREAEVHHVNSDVDGPVAAVQHHDSGAVVVQRLLEHTPVTMADLVRGTKMSKLDQRSRGKFKDSNDIFVPRSTYLTGLPGVVRIARAFLARRKTFATNVRAVDFLIVVRAAPVPYIHAARHLGQRVFVDLQYFGVGQDLLDFGRHVSDIRARQQR